MSLPQPTRFFLVLLGLLLSRYAQAQKPVPGYVITAGRDSLRGAIQIHEEIDQQLRVEFIPLYALQPIFLDAHQLAAYGYIHKKDTVRYVALPISFSKSQPPFRVFLRQLVAGPVALYDYRYSHVPLRTRPYGSNTLPIFRPLSRQTNLYTNFTLVVHREGEPNLQDVRGWDFAADGSRYFSDYPELAAELQAKKYRSDDVAKVVRRYNGWRRSQPLQP
ncbi:hypothetical protein DNI29_15170 [Hymenobacter sediminis]|uniref:hypothetical protein n=1 Tax=Hymenobacter sediminis TaxID=2218621 RepID=UPI000DA66F18|nr:hypothetical protein [Hymenobacter sediminis]RPD46337.1 hypothetical protein DNI29_15170 [Hymenobacter sediminis]